MDRRGDWIGTFTGRKFWPLDPRPEEICLEDIAHALANQCRFAGHVRQFYSVAQHSILVCELVRPPDKLWGLLHDASEAYLVDLPSPIKNDAEFGATYRQAESRVMEAVCTRFRLCHAMPKAVDEADKMAVVNEARVLMPSRGETWSWGHDIFPLGWTIVPLEPEQAERGFLDTFKIWW